MKILLTLCAAGLLLGATETANAPAVETGSVTGKALFKGERPEPKPDFTPKEEEKEGCHGDHLDMADRSLLIDENGGIANVVITIAVKGEETVVRDEPYVMDQRGCRYEPHVLVVPVGNKVRFLNSDETNHNVHTYSRKIKAINNNIAGGSEYEIEADKEETFEAKCDIHPWMKSYVVVTEANHFAVTKADGTFEIAGLPAGTYKAEYWHETLGKGKADVTIEAGKAAMLELELEAGGSKGGRGGRRR